MTTPTHITRTRTRGLSLPLAVLVALVAAVAALFFALASSAPAATAQLPNGGFESGDFTSWSVGLPPYGGGASVVSSHPWYDYPPPDYLEVTGELTAPEGSKFAVLEAGGSSQTTGEADTILKSQPFSANPGDTISFQAFYDSGDEYLDPAKVLITTTDGTTVATPFAESVQTVGQYGHTEWLAKSYTFKDTDPSGSYMVVAQVRNTGDAKYSSFIGLDDVQLTTAAADTTAPKVTTALPEGTASRTAVITVGFDEKVQNVTTETFKLDRAVAFKKGEKWVPVDATVSPDSGIVEKDAPATLTPSVDLPKGAYRVTLTGGVTDMSGNALADTPYYFYFKVGK